MSSVVLVIDTSYVIFAKYYSTLTWYKNNIAEEPDVEYIMQSPCFQMKFKSNFEKCVKKICEKYQVDTQDVIFAKDCSKGSVWRREIYPGYKDGRIHNGMFNREIFHYTFNALLPAFTQAHGGAVIDCETAEADDIIAIVHRYIRNVLNRKVIIISNDNDCIQVMDEGTQIINLMFSSVGDRRGELTPQQYLMSRIISGDRSDNIPSIFARCGIKTATKMVLQKTPEEIVKGIGEDPGHLENYNRNSLLMDLTRTPEEITAKVLAKAERFFGR